MKLVIGTPKSYEKEDILNAIYHYRQQGSTTALIEIMNINKKAFLVVANYGTARDLSKRYKININRFILVRNLHNSIIGRTGPLLFDIPAILELFK